jgi:hypothetical protein
LSAESGADTIAIPLVDAGSMTIEESSLNRSDLDLAGKTEKEHHEFTECECSLLSVSKEEKLHLNDEQFSLNQSDPDFLGKTEKEQHEFTECECSLLTVSEEEIPETYWIRTNSLSVGKRLRAGYESQLLDTRKYDSVYAAMTALNAGEVHCESFCLVLSRRMKAYYALWPSGKPQKEVVEFIGRYCSSPMCKEEKLHLNDEEFSLNQSDHDPSEKTENEQKEFTEGDSSSPAPKEEIPEGPWIHANSIGVGSFVRAGYESQLMDTRKYDSVSAALTALNVGEVDCESFCLVLSRRMKAYYILWPSGKTKKEVAEFMEGYCSSHMSKDENLNLNSVQRREGLDSSFSGVPATDSTPERTRADAGNISRFPSSRSGVTLAGDPCTIAVDIEKNPWVDARSMTINGISLHQSDLDLSGKTKKEQNEFTKGDSSSPASKEEIAEGPWIHANSIGVGRYFRAGYESQLLDTRKYDSVAAALTALNVGEVDCESFCFVLSRRMKSYYILWPSGKTKKEVNEFAKRYSSSPVSEDDKLNRNGFQGKDGLDSSCLSEGSTTDSTPEHTTTDARSMSRADESSIPKNTSPSPRMRRTMEGDADATGDHYSPAWAYVSSPMLCTEAHGFR